MEKSYKYLLNKLKREKILAKITLYNYFILKATETNNYTFLNFYEDKKRKLTKKLTCDLKELAKNFSKQNDIELKKIEEDETISREDKNLKVNSIVKEQKELLDFVDVLLATCYCVDKGRMLSLQELEKKCNFVSPIVCEFSSDIYINFAKLNNLGDDLSYLWYRSAKVKYDMPLFMTKELQEKYENHIIENFGYEPIHFKALTDIKGLREVYDNKMELKAKELYESVFPEFGFKYEDREEGTIPVYTLDWGDKYW